MNIQQPYLVPWMGLAPAAATQVPGATTTLTPTSTQGQPVVSATVSPSANGQQQQQQQQQLQQLQKMHQLAALQPQQVAAAGLTQGFAPMNAAAAAAQQYAAAAAAMQQQQQQYLSAAAAGHYGVPSTLAASGPLVQTHGGLFSAPACPLNAAYLGGVSSSLPGAANPVLSKVLIQPGGTKVRALKDEKLSLAHPPHPLFSLAVVI